MNKIKILAILIALFLSSCIRHSEGDQLLNPPNPDEIPNLDDFNDSARSVDSDDKLKELLENSDSSE